MSLIESIDSVTDIDGTDTGTVSASYVYTPTGNISKMTDPNGNTTDVVYDAIGRATKYTYANGAIETVDYDAEKNFTNATDKSGKSIWTYYDSYGNPTSKFFYDSGWKQYMGYSYDTSGRLNEQKSHRDSGKYTRETYTYDILDRPLKKTVYDGMTKLYTENYTYTISSSNLVVTKTTTAADGTAVATVKETYNKYGWLLSREISSDTETMTYSYTYDYKGRVLTETDANGGVITYEYNYDDSLNKIVYPDYSNEVFGYDLLGRNTVHFKRGLIPVRHTYDKLGRVIQTKQTMISSYSMTSKMYYDKNSNLIKESIRNNVQGDKGEETYTTTEYVYNNMNDMIGVIAADGTATQYWYDKASRVTAMKTGLSGINTSGSAPTGSIKYTYDTRGYLSKETDALGRQETYTHDYVGNVLTATDRNGAVTTNAYGSFGLTTSSVTDGTNTEKYTYTYNKVGHLTETKMYNNDTLKDTVTNTYDAFGRKTVETNGNYSNRYAYDLNSNVTNYQLLKSGIVENNVDYTYDEMNQLTGANFNGIIASYTYDDAGNIATKTVGNNVTTISYNNANLPISYETKAGDTVLNSYTYTYSLDRNRVTDVDSVNNVNKAYEYDTVGRLTKETQTGAKNIVSEFEYDARGNRIRETITGSDSYIIESEYDNNNRITWQFGIVDGIENSCIQYTYDSNGNQTRKITYADEMTDETFTYNLQNQLTGYTDGTTTASYAYGANGLRKSKTVDTTTTGFVWNGSNLAAETYSNGNIEFMYQYGADGIVAREDSESLVTLYLKNAHGDVIGLTAEDGTIDSRYIYDAFGNQLETSQDINPFRYCGEYYDAETGLIYLRARYYDSANGRFINEDPIKDGLNWYVYCGGNPVNLIDPLGLFDFDDKLSYNQSYNVDVEILQHKLVDLEYMPAPKESDWGYFGPLTQKAVNDYKNANGLWNFGQYEGVVGVTTWEHLGLTYRTQADIDAGVEISTKGLKQYKDFSKPINDALEETAEVAESKWRFNYKWFMSQVNHKKPWDIKREEPWNNTIGKDTYPGWGVKVVYNDYLMTPEELGNYTYGYIGAALGLTKMELYSGSWYAADFPTGGADWDNEYNDWSSIKKGADDYK